MKTLQSIQKAFQVFEILTKVARIICIVGACLCAVGVLCAVTRYNGGEVFFIFGEPLQMFPADADWKKIFAMLITAMVLLAAEILLLAFAGQYFRVERTDGTPFTEHGADLLKKLGIRCIYVPIVAIVISAVVTAVLGMPDVDGGIVSNLPGIGVGLILILASFIFRYGAELEGKANARLADSGESGLDS